MQQASGIKRGDTVLVLRTAEDGEMGWDNSWAPCMDHEVGEEHVVHSVAGSSGIVLDKGSMYYPFYVPELIDSSVPTRFEVGSTWFMSGSAFRIDSIRDGHMDEYAGLDTTELWPNRRPDGWTGTNMARAIPFMAPPTEEWLRRNSVEIVSVRRPDASDSYFGIYQSLEKAFPHRRTGGNYEGLRYILKSTKKTIVLDGKSVEVSEESFKALKKSLIG